jgi:hypothetical protein
MVGSGEDFFECVRFHEGQMLAASFRTCLRLFLSIFARLLIFNLTFFALLFFCVPCNQKREKKFEISLCCWSERTFLLLSSGLFGKSLLFLGVPSFVFPHHNSSSVGLLLRLFPPFPSPLMDLEEKKKE